MSKSRKQQLDRILDECEALGCRIETGKHVKVFCPDGRTIVVFSRTPSDVRAYANACALLRRAGIDVRP